MGNPFWSLLEGDKYEETHCYRDGRQLKVLFELRKGSPHSRQQAKKRLSVVVGRSLSFRYYEANLNWQEDVLTLTSIVRLAVDCRGEHRGDICVVFLVREWTHLRAVNVPSAEREGC